MEVEEEAEEVEEEEEELILKKKTLLISLCVPTGSQPTHESRSHPPPTLQGLDGAGLAMNVLNCDGWFSGDAGDCLLISFNIL